MAMKTIFLLMLLSISLVYAEEGGRLVRPDGFVAEPDGTAFAFVPALSSLTQSQSNG
jgi:hypothetical protein